MIVEKTIYRQNNKYVTIRMAVYSDGLNDFKVVTNVYTHSRKNRKRTPLVDTSAYNYCNMTKEEKRAYKKRKFLEVVSQKELNQCKNELINKINNQINIA